MMSETVAARSQLFMLRVWLEEVGDSRTEFRGTLKHVLSGETHHFRDWATLVQLIESLVTTKQTDQWGKTNRDRHS